MAATKQKKRAKDFINTSYAGRAFFSSASAVLRRSAVVVLGAQAAACACAAATFRAATGPRAPLRAAAAALPCFFRLASYRQRSPPPVPRPGEAHVPGTTAHSHREKKCLTYSRR